jgi:dTDP-glucose 4,6-dehydratase
MIVRILDRLRPRDDGFSYQEQVCFVEDRPGHDHRYAIDPTKLETQLGWRAAETFETGIEKTVAWYLANEAWWMPLRLRRYPGERLGLPAVALSESLSDRLSA